MKKIAEFLTDSSKWTTGEVARDEEGQPCAVEYGYSFCLYGLVDKFYEKDRVIIERLILKSIKQLYPKHQYISIFNDDPSTTFEDIKRVIELAGV